METVDLNFYSFIALEIFYITTMSQKTTKQTKRVHAELEKLMEGVQPKYHENRFLKRQKKVENKKYWLLETPLNEEEFTISVADLQRNYMCRLVRMEFHRIQRMPVNEPVTDDHSTVGLFCCPVEFDPELFKDYFNGDVDYRLVEFKNKL